MKKGPAYVIIVTVRNEDQLSREYRVGPTGVVSFEMIGSFDVEGMTIPQLREMLAREYDKYIISPYVTVNLRELGGRRVSVHGEVRIPGQYIVKPGSRAMDAIVAAGGIVERRADLTKVQLVREGITMLLDLQRFRQERDSSQNIVLSEGDEVFVPARYVGTVLVTGYVVAPGEVEVAADETLVDVIGRAGGLAQGADPSKIAITRPDGSIETFDYRKAAADEPFANPFIKPADKIDVKENVDYMVSVVGAVVSPGAVAYVEGMTFSTAMARAGGPASGAVTKRIRILRTVDKEGGVTESIPVDYGRVMGGESPDLVLEPGDMIDVPRREPEKLQQWTQYISAAVGV